MPVSAAAVAERRVIERLLRANAVTPTSADPLGGLRGLEQRRLRHLITEGVVEALPDGRYFLHAPALADYLVARRRRIVIALMVVIVLMGVLTLMGGLVVTTRSVGLGR